MADLAPTSPPAAVQQGPAERVWWCIYDAPHGARAEFLVVRWRAIPGHVRALADEPIYRPTIELARGVVPLGLVRSAPKKRMGKHDRLLETWSEAT